MRLKITHTTEYRFSQPVFLEAHTFRLRPRCDATQRLVAFRMGIDPAPACLSENVDLDGNATVVAWFDQPASRLSITAHSEVETLRANPFGFLLLEPADTFPWRYAPELTGALAPYLLRPAPDPEVDRFAREVADEAHGVLPFLMHLTSRVYDLCAHSIRESGQPYAPAQTLEQRSGSCRDFTVLFMDLCRSLGLAARFVSGYQFGGDANDESHYLHAWPEVYLPGGGWRGYDPTHGLAVAGGHVALASGAAPPDAAPVTGTFRGTGATARLETHLEISGSRSAGW